MIIAQKKIVRKRLR